jgi:GNAT superfamily N-acetyltransferase
VDSVELVNLDVEATDLLLASPEAFEKHYRLSLGAHRELAASVARQTRDVVAPRSPDPRWWGYLAVHPTDRDVVGTCGFRAGPDANGEVEIAYFTFPGFEGQGVATAMAWRLLHEVAERRLRNPIEQEMAGFSRERGGCEWTFDRSSSDITRLPTHFPEETLSRSNRSSRIEKT